MKTRLGRMEAFDALLESRFGSPSVRPLESTASDRSSEDGDRRRRRSWESERESLPMAPLPAHDAAHARSVAAHLVWQV